MRTYNYAHNIANTERWKKRAQVILSSGTAANQAVFGLRHVNNKQHPGVRKAAKVGGVYLALITCLAAIAYLAG